MPKTNLSVNIINESKSYKDLSIEEIKELNEQARLQNEANGIIQLPDEPFEG